MRALTLLLLWIVPLTTHAVEVGNRAPELVQGTWLNTKAPLTLANLGGRVVLITFWTFACSNCRNTIPPLKRWYDAYKSRGLEVIGVHTPELALERDPRNLAREVHELGIRYPVMTDSSYANWSRYRQQYWPTMYLIDRSGVIRYVQVGEGNYGATEQEIQLLLGERMPKS